MSLLAWHFEFPSRVRFRTQITHVAARATVIGEFAQWFSHELFSQKRYCLSNRIVIDNLILIDDANIAKYFLCVTFAGLPPASWTHEGMIVPSPARWTRSRTIMRMIMIAY